MDMETVLPRTCNICNGLGVIYYGNEEDFEVEVCECKSK